MALEQRLDALGKLLEHSPDIDTVGSYCALWDTDIWGSPLGVFVIGTKHCSRGSLPRLPSFGVLT